MVLTNEKRSRVKNGEHLAQNPETQTQAPLRHTSQLCDFPFKYFGFLISKTKALDQVMPDRSVILWTCGLIFAQYFILSTYFHAFIQYTI